jgi:hypothetical protein
MTLPFVRPAYDGRASFLFRQTGLFCCLACNARDFGRGYRDAVEAPQPWQNLSPAMMRVPHLAQKPEVRAGAGAGIGADIGADIGACDYAGADGP